VKRKQDWSRRRLWPLKLPLKSIKTRRDVSKFFRWLLDDQRLNFHPDTPFEGYVRYTTGSPVYTEAEADVLNKLMRQAFEVADDVYASAIREFEKYDQRRGRR